MESGGNAEAMIDIHCMLLGTAPAIQTATTLLPRLARSYQALPMTDNIGKLRSPYLIGVLHAVVQAFAAIPVPRDDGCYSRVVIGPIHIVVGVVLDHLDVAISGVTC